MRILSRAAPLFLLFLWVGTAGIVAANFISAAEKIDINTAPLEDLVKIIHIGKVRALDLISLRPFSSLDDLVKIKGLGKSRVEDIKKQGLAWIDTIKESQNESAIEKPVIEVNPQQIEPESKIVYPSGIVINEILPSPEGPDETEEWIEVFNQNSFEANLSDWKITDTVGSVKTYIFPGGTGISSQGFLVFSRPTTKITLNNDGDGVNLLQPDGKIIDSVSYEKAPRDQSYNRTRGGWTWSTILTPDALNKTPALTTGVKFSEKEIEESLPENATKKEDVFSKEMAAAIGKQAPTKDPYFLLISLIASVVAIFSGLIILFLKTRLQQKKNLLN